MFSFFGKRTRNSQTPRSKSKSPDRLAKRSLSLENLENRLALTSFAVVNLHDSGEGSLRQAITNANEAGGSDIITFDVAGTIELTSGALPAITDTVFFQGQSAPGFVGAPMVEVDLNGFDGLDFEPAAAGSTLASLAFVHSATNGAMINGGGQMLIEGNYFGVDLDGVTAEGNGGNGLELYGSSNNTIRSNVVSGNNGFGIVLTAGSTLNTLSLNLIGTDATGTAALGNRLDGLSITSSNNNLVGQVVPGTNVAYYNANNVGVTVNGWQGIRNSPTAGQYLLTGTSGDNGILVDGAIDGTGANYTVAYPQASETTVYGPDIVGGDVLRLVGTYKNSDSDTAAVAVNGFYFEGTEAQLNDPDNNSALYHTLNYPGAKYNYVHSSMGGLIVGNYDSPTDDAPVGPGHAFLYNANTQAFLPDIAYPGAASTTAYGIWYNGGTSYTICGGYGMGPGNLDQQVPIGSAYLVDFDSATNEFSHWTSFSDPAGVNLVTHFEGLSSVEPGVYTIRGDTIALGTGNPIQGSFVTVRRNDDGSFGQASWVKLNYPGYPSTYWTSNDSVYGNQVVGIVAGVDNNLPLIFSFQATVGGTQNTSNLISGNGANGIGLYEAANNQIAMNQIGTDITGTVDLGNAANGILITSNSAGNMIGGEATGGNDPTEADFVRPPQGNLISGNDCDGIRITGRATGNQISGNYIGTDAFGTSALGNTRNGVSIQNANGNALIGCNFEQNPFVFYNVISGNGGNGLDVKNSNDTTIQANFFGLGADNFTPVGNALNGVLIEGSSTRTTMGGPIPLGNVDAANGQNGIFVRDTASYFTTYNTFCGLAAFETYTNLGNGANGMLITSTGGNILIRTNVVTENALDGIQIAGNATDVRVAGNIVGLDTDGVTAMGNHRNGIQVGGQAHNIVIGGPQPTFNIIPQNTISANAGYGVAIVGTANNITVSHSYIGTDIGGINDTGLGNGLSGVLLGPGTYSNTVGSNDPTLLTLISGNLGNGIEINGTHDNTVLGTYIGTDFTGTLDLGNGANGILISNSWNNTIGRGAATLPSTRSFLLPPLPSTPTNSPNIIANNVADGVYVASGFSNIIRANSIYGNTGIGIGLAPGANASQAAPVLTRVLNYPSGVQVFGTLTSRPNTNFTVDLYANYAPGSSGRFFLGTVTVRTNAAGVGSFAYFALSPPVGAAFFSATATDPNNNTSQFSNAVS